MRVMSLLRFVPAVLLAFGAAIAQAADAGCAREDRPAISFVQFTSPNIAVQPPIPNGLTIKGKLSLPAGSSHGHCDGGRQRLPAVIILHGSSGIDARGDFYQAALNAAGIATLQIDMWEARGVTGGATRPAAPILTYPDAFSALGFLAQHPQIDPDRIGVFGFSWGGVVSVGSAEQMYARMFGAGRTFKAHVANYPVCYAFNNTVPQLPPAATLGLQFLHPTGAPMLIQIGSKDGYDNGAANCRALARSVDPAQRFIRVVEYPGASHAWDRLMVPITVTDMFADEGSFFSTGKAPIVDLVPDVEEAFASREQVVRFFRRHL
ncbi:MAG TPA: dienelactone hydrolase family protein [Burkholderiaceae bacterium]|nr:dienelactone hydrolase family protein [Burkholderiaceae bacterium]